MANTQSNNIFSKIGAFYDRVTEGDSAVYTQIFRSIRPYLSPDKTVLELACGTGLISRAAAPYVKFIEATDRSKSAIDRARRKGTHPSLHYAVQDASALPYEAKSFDIVLMVNALHQVSSPEKVLSEIHRVLKDGGILIAPTYVNEDKNGIPRSALLASFVNIGTKSPWTADTFFEFLLANGFVVTEHHIIGNGVKLPVCFASAEKVVK